MIAIATVLSAVAGLTFESSDRQLTAGFAWSAREAVSYVQTGKACAERAPSALPLCVCASNGSGCAPNIPSCWAGYASGQAPRHAFYLRDMSHQSRGAHLIGLNDENFAMAQRFARSATPARKYFPVWSFSFNGSIYPMDYKNDSYFVRELPEPFDLIHRLGGLVRWTGERRWTADATLTAFYDAVLTKFLPLWTPKNQTAEFEGVAGLESLGDGDDIFRGVTSYNEQAGEPLVYSGDAIANQYGAYLSLQRIALARSPPDAASAAKAAAAAAKIRRQYNSHWQLSPLPTSGAGFARGFLRDGLKPLSGWPKKCGCLMEVVFPLVVGLADAGSKATDLMLDEVQAHALDVHETITECRSQIPEGLFRYGRPQAAVEVLRALMHDSRRTYPEVSYAFVDNMVSGVLGLAPDAPSQTAISVLNLPADGSVAWAEATGIRVGDFELALRQSWNSSSGGGGSRSSRLSYTKWHGAVPAPSLAWSARIRQGDAEPRLYVNGSAAAATFGSTIAGDTRLPLLCVNVSLAEGATLLVSTAPAARMLRTDDETSAEGSIYAWHVTDPHVDPMYTRGAPTEGCYCRAHDKCPARPSETRCKATAGGPAGIFGNAEADCETPKRLFASALAHAAAVPLPAASASPPSAGPQLPLVFFTGDFCAYMLETPCNASATGLEPGSSRSGLLGCIGESFDAVRAAFPGSPVLPSLGNHDTVVMPYTGTGGEAKSGAAFTGSKQMAWLYGALADAWATPEAIGCSGNGTNSTNSSVGGPFSCAEARRTLLLGGYYSTRLTENAQPRLGLGGLNLTVLSLNTNYWSLESNPALGDGAGNAWALGQGMLGWAEGVLGAAAARGDKVLVLGHIPPWNGMWMKGTYRRWVAMLTPHYRAGLQLHHFLGHMHLDEFALVRACDDDDEKEEEEEETVEECTGEPLGLMAVGPSVSFAFPAANPALRLLEFGGDDLALRDMKTFAADLHAANANGSAAYFRLEYSFAKAFGDGVDGGVISPASVAALVERMAANDSSEWEAYRGGENGTFYCKGWQADATGKKADSHCKQPCGGACKSEWLSVVNGTNSTWAPGRP